jgi:hypothetical protein
MSFAPQPVTPLDDPISVLTEMIYCEIGAPDALLACDMARRNAIARVEHLISDFIAKQTSAEVRDPDEDCDADILFARKDAEFLFRDFPTAA